MRMLSRICFSLLITAAAVPAWAQGAGAGYEEVGYAAQYSPTFHGYPTESQETYNHEGFTAAHPTLPFNTSVKIVRVDDGRAVTVRINDRMQPGPQHVIDLSGGAARALGMNHGVALVKVVPVSGATAQTNWYPSASPTTVPSATAGTVTVPIGTPATASLGMPIPTAASSSWTPTSTVPTASSTWTQPATQPTAQLYPNANGSTWGAPSAWGTQGATSSGSTTPSFSGRTGRFTLQLGAFEQQATAMGLKNRMQDSWIQETNDGFRTLYKVYYKQFNQREQAEAERDRLRSQGVDSFIKAMQ